MFDRAIKANACGVSIYCLDVVCVIAATLFLVLFGRMLISIVFAVLNCCLSVILNYKKYILEKGNIPVSFWRWVLFDSFFPVAGYAIILCENSQGYLDLISLAIYVCTMVPVIFTNRKIQKDLLAMKESGAKSELFPEINNYIDKK